MTFSVSVCLSPHDPYRPTASHCSMSFAVIGQQHTGDISTAD